MHDTAVDASPPATITIATEPQRMPPGRFRQLHVMVTHVAHLWRLPRCYSILETRGVAKVRPNAAIAIACRSESAPKRCNNYCVQVRTVESTLPNVQVIVYVRCTQSLTRQIQCTFDLSTVALYVLTSSRYPAHA
jgi:hypothetical protein